MEKQNGKEKIYCIFNSKKEDINSKIEKVFEIYINEQLRTKENLENNKGKD